MSARAAWRLEQLGFTDVYDYATGRKDWEAAGLPIEGTDVRGPIVADATDHNPPTTTVDATVGQARVVAAGDSQVIVVNDGGVVVGAMRKESWDHPDDASVEDAMRPGPATDRPGSQLAPLVERMEAKQVESVIVSDPEGRLIGVMRLDAGRDLLADGKLEKTFEACDSCPGWWRYRIVNT